MELETIIWARQRALQGHVTNLRERVTTLEGRSIASSQTSADRWQQVKELAEFAPKIIGLLRLLWHTWPLILAGIMAVWTLVLPGLRWLLRALSSALTYLAGLHVG